MQYDCLWRDFGKKFMRECLLHTLAIFSVYFAAASSPLTSMLHRTRTSLRSEIDKPTNQQHATLLSLLYSWNIPHREKKHTIVDLSNLYAGLGDWKIILSPVFVLWMLFFVLFFYIWCTHAFRSHIRFLSFNCKCLAYASPMPISVARKQASRYQVIFHQEMDVLKR